jgi:hypothetical protein
VLTKQSGRSREVLRSLAAVVSSDDGQSMGSSATALTAGMIGIGTQGEAWHLAAQPNSGTTTRATQGRSSSSKAPSGVLCGEISMLGGTRCPCPRCQSRKN